MSQYDNIKTPAELIRSVRVHGLSLNTEDICRAQDIFGRCPIENLEELAKNSDTRDDFYFVLFQIWYWRDATNFYNRVSNPEFVIMQELKEQLKYERGANASLKIEAKHAAQARKEAEKDSETLKKRVEELEATEHELADANIRLKAKLYDMIAEKEVP